MGAAEPVRVMLVDDQADVRFLVKVILDEHPDLELVASVATAPEALQAAAAERPDVALVDARMPLVSGFELAPQLLSQAPGLRVAILTAIVDDVVEAEALAAGARLCISKADFDHLPDAVRRLARG